MSVFIIILGLSFVGIGYLVKYYPDMISGYNTMPREKKKNVDIKGLSRFMFKSMIIIGATIIFGYYFFYLIRLYVLAELMIIIPIIGGVIIMVIKSQKYDHNIKSRNQYYIQYSLLILMLLFVVWIVFRGCIPSKIVVEDNAIKFTGTYGITINKEDIDGVELAYSIPAITIRTNGLAFAGVKKGHFNLKEYGNCLLFMQNNSAPFLIIKDKKGKIIISNNSDTTITRVNYDKLKHVLP